MQILAKWNADFSDVWRSPPLSRLKVGIKRRRTRGWGHVSFFLKHGQMLHCASASIKSSQTEILDRGNKHEGERSTGGIMGRETTCAKASVAKSMCPAVLVGRVFLCLRVFTSGQERRVYRHKQKKRPNKRGYEERRLHLFVPFSSCSPQPCVHTWFHAFFLQWMVTMFLFLYRCRTGIGVSTCYCT